MLRPTTTSIIALMLVYLVMVAIFTRWGDPLLIMATIPLGVAGGIGGLWLLNQAGVADVSARHGRGDVPGWTPL